MNRYLDGFDQFMSNVQTAAENEQDPHRSEILWNYLHHAALEFSDKWDHIFEPEMTVDDPRYVVRLGMEETVVFDGLDHVEGFYSALNEALVMLLDEGNHQVFVNDWGLADFSTYVEFAKGEEILEDGLDKIYYKETEIDDPDATYVMECPLAMFWPYDDNAKLIGEHVYQLEPFEVYKPDQDEVPTFEERGEVCENYYPENTPSPMQIEHGQ